SQRAGDICRITAGFDNDRGKIDGAYRASSRGPYRASSRGYYRGSVDERLEEISTGYRGRRDLKKSYILSFVRCEFSVGHIGSRVLRYYGYVLDADVPPVRCYPVV